MISVGESSTCTECHSEGEEGYIIAELIYDKIKNLSSLYDSTKAISEKVNIMGMNNIEIEYSLKNIKQNLIQSRTLVHTFDTSEVFVKANEGILASYGAIKLARAYTGRSKIISFIRSYHGSTYGAITLSGISLNMSRKIGPLLPEIYHMPFPDTYHNSLGGAPEDAGKNCLDYLKYAFENYLPPDEVAAVIIEPIQGDAGIVVPPGDYMQELFKLCKENGILFISEEVQQGMGRTGKWFGIEHFNIEPDIVIMAKALASGMPLSALIGRKEIMEALEAPAHLFTTAGNPVCCAAALATIKVIEEEKLMENAEKLNKIAFERFTSMKDKFPFIGEVRGLGLSIGVDLIKDPVTKERNKEAAAKICYCAWQKGLLLSFFSNSVLRIQPPLIITEVEFNKGINIIETCMTDLQNGLLGDDILKVTKGW